MNDALIVFVKNPEKGKVKTRLAASIGDEKALKVYKHLLQYTAKLIKKCKVKTSVFYNQKVELSDVFEVPTKQKFIQEGKDLGEKMFNAFNEHFKDGNKKVVLIGSDCAEIDEHIVLQAFSKLDQYEAVLGPAKDGGYYLIGLKTSLPALFLQKSWSHENVLTEAMEVLNSLNLSFYLLPQLRDVDREEDLTTIKEFKLKK